MISICRFQMSVLRVSWQHLVFCIYFATRVLVEPEQVILFCSVCYEKRNLDMSNRTYPSANRTSISHLSADARRTSGAAGAAARNCNAHAFSEYLSEGVGLIHPEQRSTRFDRQKALQKNSPRIFSSHRLSDNFQTNIAFRYPLL